MEHKVERIIIRQNSWQAWEVRISSFFYQLTIPLFGLPISHKNIGLLSQMRTTSVGFPFWCMHVRSASKLDSLDKIKVFQCMML